MAIILQKPLFDWEKIHELGDLKRLQFVLEYLPDETLMTRLESLRGICGRNDYPIRPVWNSILAGIVFQHPSIESLRRELSRNGQLRYLCGFDPTGGVNVIPPSWAYSRFIKNLFELQDELDNIFHMLVSKLARQLPGFGKILAHDGKALPTFARPHEETLPFDGRRDTEANWGIKKYRGVDENGRPWKKIKKWFGYNLHLLVDAQYEIPVCFAVSDASSSEIPYSMAVFDEYVTRHKGLCARAEYYLGDKGFDTTGIHRKLWEEHGVKPIIPIRKMWKDGEATKQVHGLENIVYDQQGTVSCICMYSGEKREMAFGGFEKERSCLKYRCPAKQYGYTCKYIKRCTVKQSIRIPLDEDRRIFSPVARSSYKWKRLYKKRTSVERVNSRIDRVYCFEDHTIRGKRKMTFRITLAFIVMLSIALGHTQENNISKIRCLV